jgi:hypothetical protein
MLDMMMNEKLLILKFSQIFMHKLHGGSKQPVEHVWLSVRIHFIYCFFIFVTSGGERRQQITNLIMLVLYGERIQTLKMFMSMPHGSPISMGASVDYNYIQLDVLRYYNMCKGQLVI